MGQAHITRLRVRWSECDPQGIVFNGNYLDYCDVALTELWREALGSWPETEARGLTTVVGRTELDFRAPARFDDLVEVATSVERFGTSSFTVAFDLTRARDQLVAVRTVYVCVDPATLAKIDLPTWTRTGLDPWHNPAGSG